MYKRGVARSFHGNNFCEKSGGVSCFVVLLLLNSHRSSVLCMDTGKHHFQLFSGGQVLYG